MLLCKGNCAVVASFEADTEAVTWVSGNEASDVIDHGLLAKRIKLRYSASS